jgi:hypothetical protein
VWEFGVVVFVGVVGFGWFEFVVGWFGVVGWVDG